MTAKPKILFITNEEHGQSNIHITIIATLLQLYPEQVDLHLCSFTTLSQRCLAGATFHAIEGTGMTALSAENWARAHAGKRPASHPPTTLGVIRNSLMFRDMLFPWSDSTYLDLVGQTRRVIESVRPDLVLVDPLCAFGIDAVRSVGAKAVTLSPVSWAICARVIADEVNRHRFLSWPGISSGNPYPVPWLALIPNAFQAIFAVLCLLFLPSIRRLNRLRTSAGLASVNPVLNVPKPVLCPGTMALDFRGQPTLGVLPFGPIMMSYPPLVETHPELAEWLDQGGGAMRGRGKTILIALGSHVRLDEREVRAMMSALQDILLARPDLKVLWKLVPDTAHYQALDDLDKLVTKLAGRLRVVQWLEADPAVLLQSGHVGAFVHHGGGNSYHEALGTGVPQIVLPSWMDCYTFAQRVVDLGIGIWANRKEAPSFSAEPLREALFAVLGRAESDPIAAAYAAKAIHAVRVARDPDMIPLAPGGLTELDAVRECRERQKTSADPRAAGVEGSRAAAEWIYRSALANSSHAQ